ncbi:MAG: hypothetical protein HWE22_07785 [Flavobacteriales bacterium]|nr:hypothetical protein [Flavobacteriales bacterium]
MKLIVSFTLLLFTTLSFSQCYNCNYDRSDQKRARGPKKAFKKDFPGIKKIKWYTCEDIIYYGVKNFSDSSITYIYSNDDKFLGKETRYFNRVVKYTEEPETKKESFVKCVSPDILPENLWPQVAEIYKVENLDTLNHVDGMPFWVCDIYKVELPEAHIVAQKEGTTTFFIVNTDFQFHVFTKSEKLEHLDYLIEFHPAFYVEGEYIYGE